MKPARPTSTPRQTPTQVRKSTPDLQEQIRRRAYELYEQRGRGDGHRARRLAASRDRGDSEEDDGSIRIEPAIAQETFPCGAP
jgi:hypothetical protein